MPTAPAPGASDDLTIVRPPMVVSPHLATTPTSDTAGAATPDVDSAVVAAAETPAPATSRARRGLWIALSTALAVVVVIGAIVGLNVLVAGIDPAPEATESVEPQDVAPDFVPKVVELGGTRQGEQIVFTWVNRDPQEGDSFIWNVVSVSGPGEIQQAPEPVVQVAASPGTVCIDVMLRREDGRVSEPVRGCVDG